MITTIFSFAFAGGSRYSYKNYFPASSGLNWIPTEYPGHGSRISEPLLNDLKCIAEDAFNQIKNNLSQPYALYGHSMGAMVAFLVARQIVREKLPSPLHLFLTGRGGPSIVPSMPPTYTLRSSEFWAAVKALGGVPDDVLQDESLMEFFEPILRSDFQAIETHQCQMASPINIPITVMIGTNEKVTYEEALAWQSETVQPIEVKQFPGGHFFIFDHPQAVVQLIDSKLSEQLVTMS
jgi:surfactin synthase thioesterase subunit